ncbi:unnamed protein product [Trichobilharzia regenti]|nr:unnamed protein product [Trichobilharzia regenti]
MNLYSPLNAGQGSCRGWTCFFYTQRTGCFTRTLIAFAVWSMPYHDVFASLFGCLIISQALALPCFSSENRNLNQKFGLIRLFLSENRITSSSMNSLAAGLKRCARLTTLQLCGNTNIGSVGLRALKSGLINSPCLKRLGIAFCGIDNQGALHISEILTKTKSRFTLIDLTGNLIDSEGSLTIAKCSTYLNENFFISSSHDPFDVTLGSMPRSPSPFEVLLDSLSVCCGM